MYIHVFPNTNCTSLIITFQDFFLIDENGNSLSNFRTKLNETQTKYLKGFSHQLNREYSSKQKGVARVDAFPAFWAQNSIR